MDSLGEFSDVNEAVSEEWESETTPYERVREVISQIYTSVSAGEVAEDARTTPKTARKHLNTLADEGFVTTETGKQGGTYYRRSPESLVLEQAADILQQVSIDELVDRITDMRETISDFQDEYGVDTPEELTVEQTNQLLAEVPSTTSDIDPDDLQEWQTTRRNLAFANAALSIANAERFVDGDTSSTNGSVPVQ
jgi:DNA-binding transcriptional regulator YhcF (GntR family)